MNNQDIEILSYIRHNCRNSITEMSRDFGLPVLEMMDRIKSYEKTYIKNYTCVLDFEKVGLKVDSYLKLEIDVKEKKSFERFISNCKPVNSIFIIEDGKYLIECLFREEIVLNKFIEKMKRNFTIIELEVLRVKREIKREVFLDS